MVLHNIVAAAIAVTAYLCQAICTRYHSSTMTVNVKKPGTNTKKGDVFFNSHEITILLLTSDLCLLLLRIIFSLFFSHPFFVIV